MISQRRLSVLLGRFSLSHSFVLSCLSKPFVTSVIPGRAGDRVWPVSILFRFRFGGLATQAIALAGELENLGVFQQAVQDRRGGGDVSDEFPPIFKRSIILRPFVVLDNYF